MREGWRRRRTEGRKEGGREGGRPGPLTLSSLSVSAISTVLETLDFGQARTLSIVPVINQRVL